MAAVIKGTVCTYGVTGTEASLFVQSYDITNSFISEDTVVNESGLTVTWRADDRTAELSLEGIAKTANPPKLGDTITFNLATNSNNASSSVSNTFQGVVTGVTEKGGSKEFVKVSVKAKDWEAISI